MQLPKSRRSTSRIAISSPSRGWSASEINFLLDLADKAADDNRQAGKRRDLLRGRTLINLFFEASTRTQSSFEMAAKRLGADVMNMNVSTSSVQKGETLIDTAMTLNAMRPDIIVVRHHAAGAVELLAQKIDCSVINAGDGSHQHPTQALLDALTIRRAKGRIAGLTVAICGDVLHSRVARSNIIVLNALGARVRIAAPSTLLPAAPERLGAEVFTDMWKAVEGADVVMMLRLQRERMEGSYVPSTREYFHFFGLDQEKLARAKPDAIVMHPGPDEPRRRDRLHRRRPFVAASSAIRWRWASPCAWRCSRRWPATCRNDERTTTTAKRARARGQSRRRRRHSSTPASSIRRRTATSRAASSCATASSPTSARTCAAMRRTGRVVDCKATCWRRLNRHRLQGARPGAGPHRRAGVHRRAGL